MLLEYWITRFAGDDERWAQPALSDSNSKNWLAMMRVVGTPPALHP
jgi:hypothetical protein